MAKSKTFLQKLLRKKNLLVLLLLLGLLTVLVLLLVLNGTCCVGTVCPGNKTCCPPLNDRQQVCVLDSK